MNIVNDELYLISFDDKYICLLGKEIKKYNIESSSINGKCASLQTFKKWHNSINKKPGFFKRLRTNKEQNPGLDGIEWQEANEL